MTVTASGVEYRGVPGFPGYRVGNDGSVWSRWRKKGLGYGRGIARVLGEEWKELSRASDSAGYFVVPLRRDQKTHVVKVHWLVLTAFVGPRPAGMHGCHNDGHPQNNAIGNLRWDTPAGNNADKKRHGTEQRGERCGTSKLTEPQVLDVKRRLAAGESCASIGRSLDVTPEAISAIKIGRTWAWLTPPFWRPAKEEDGR